MKKYYAGIGYIFYCFQGEIVQADAIASVDLSIDIPDFAEAVNKSSLVEVFTNSYNELEFKTDKPTPQSTDEIWVLLMVDGKRMVFTSYGSLIYNKTSSVSFTDSNFEVDITCSRINLLDEFIFSDICWADTILSLESYIKKTYSLSNKQNKNYLIFVKDNKIQKEILLSEEATWDEGKLNCKPAEVTDLPVTYDTIYLVSKINEQSAINKFNFTSLNCFLGVEEEVEITYGTVAFYPLKKLIKKQQNV